MEPCFFIQGHGRKILSGYLETDRGKSQSLQLREKMVQEGQGPSLPAKCLFRKKLIQIDIGAMGGEKAGDMRVKSHSLCSLKRNGRFI